MVKTNDVTTNGDVGWRANRTAENVYYRFERPFARIS